MTQPTGGRHLDCIEAERHRREKGESDVNLASSFFNFPPGLKYRTKGRETRVLRKKNRYRPK